MMARKANYIAVIMGVCTVSQSRAWVDDDGWRCMSMILISLSRPGSDPIRPPSSRLCKVGQRPKRPFYAHEYRTTAISVPYLSAFVFRSFVVVCVRFAVLLTLHFHLHLHLHLNLQLVFIYIYIPLHLASCIDFALGVSLPAGRAPRPRPGTRVAVVVLVNECN
jgi:hypothetical protein